MFQSRNIRVAALAVIGVLVVVAVVIAAAAFLRQSSVIEERQIETVPATVRADRVPALSIKLDRGDLVDIVGEEDSYYLVEYRGEQDMSGVYGNVSADVDADPDDSADAVLQEAGNAALISGHGTAMLYIDKNYVRQTGEGVPDQWTGYIQSPASLFSTALLTGDVLADLEQNTEVTVLDTFADRLFIELGDGTRGYISAKVVGTAPVAIEANPEPEQVWDDGGSYGYYAPQYYGGGGGGQTGGWQGGNIDLGGDNAGADGGDIELPDPTVANYANFAMGRGSLFVEPAYADEAPAAQAVVLSDGIQTYLGWFDRGETVDIADTAYLSEEEVALIPEGTSVVVMDGQWGLIDNILLKFENDEDYEPWEGYVAAGAGFFPLYTLQGEATILEINQNVTVIDDLSTCYVVMFGDQLGYMAKSEVSATPYEEPEPEEVVDYSDDYSYYGGGYYDYGYGGSGPTVDAGNTGSTNEVIENTIGGWTDEKL